MSAPFADVLAALPGFDLRDVPALRQAFSVARPPKPLTDPQVEVSEMLVPGPGTGGVGVRLYRPTARGAGRPVLVYCHGGGFVLGSLETDHSRCLRFAAEAGYVVVSVDYRLAPEHPFPAAFDDCRAVLDWVVESAEALGANRRRLAVGGTSAGGCLAAALSLVARDEGGPAIAFQILIYPALDDRLATSSIKEFWDCAGWNGAATAMMWRHYLGGSESPSEYGAPARAASLRGLPPTYLMVADADPLRDEGLEFAVRLQRDAVPTEVHSFAGVPHGFDLFVPDAPVSERSVTEQVLVLREFASSRI